MAARVVPALVLFGFAFVAQAADSDRIVALGGAITEILYALGQQEKIVAVDATSLYPPQALKDKPSVGYFRAVSAEGILSARPTRVLMVEGSGPAAALETVAQAGIPVSRVPDASTAEGVAAKIIAVGEAAGVSEEARKLADQVKARFGELAQIREKLTASKRVLFVIALQNGRPLVGGKGTAGDAIVTLAGGTNVASFDGYKPMADEAIIDAAPEAIVMMQRSGGSVGEDILSLPSVAGHSGRKSARVDHDGWALSSWLRTARARCRPRSDAGAVSEAGSSPFDREWSGRTMTAIEADVASLTTLFLRQGRRRVAIATGLGVCLCAVLVLIALGSGAIPIPPRRVAAILSQFFLGWTSTTQDRETLVVIGIRLPRVLLGLEIGAALAISGALMQGLFRNPLADPGIIGVSSGAALAAAAIIVLGDRFLGGTEVKLPFAILPASAFCGGLAATLAIYAIATRQGCTSTATMLLGGIGSVPSLVRSPAFSAICRTISSCAISPSGHLETSTAQPGARSTRSLSSPYLCWPQYLFWDAALTLSPSARRRPFTSAYASSGSKRQP